jgi:hypothetical protein
MFFPFRPDLGFSKGMTKRDIVALIIVLMIWGFALWHLLQGPAKNSMEPKQKTHEERTATS